MTTKGQQSDFTPASDGYPIKLVRDRTPEVLNSTREPGDLFYGPAPPDRMRWLRFKLVEEVGEYLVDGGFAELVDVFSVIKALAVEHGRSFTYLRMCAENHPRGGFQDAVMMYGRHAEFDSAEAGT